MDSPVRSYRSAKVNISQINAFLKFFLRIFFLLVF